MATPTTTAPAEIPRLAAADKAFMDSWYQAVKDHPAASRKYTEWGTALAKIPTYDEKLAYIRAIVNNTDSKYKDKIPPLAVNWLVESNPGIVDSKGDAFSTDFYKGIISGDAKTRTANSTALKTAKTKVATESAKLANPKATPAELATIVDDIVNGSSTKPYNPATLTTAASSTPSASLYKAGSMSADKLKSTYGNILDPDTGKALFSDDYLKKVASATTASGVQGFNDTLSKVASKVLASQTGSNYLVQSDADKADALTNLLKNPETLASGTKSLYNSAESKTGINGLLPVGSFKDDKGNFVYNGGEIPSKNMSEFVQTYNNQGVANRGAYIAPTYNVDKNMYESKSTSPYAGALTSLLGSVKNPFASDYTSSLATRQPAAMTSTQLANISKPFKENTTARDIINLQNSAGMRTGNELTKGSSLSKNLLDLYQTNPDDSAINSPWVADTEDMVIPTTTRPDIDTSTELVQLDPGGLLREQGVIDPNLAANQATAAGINTLAGGTQYTDMNYITPAMRQQIAADPTILQRRPDLQGAMDWSIKQDARFWPSLSESQKVYTPSSTDAVGIDTLAGNTVADNAGVDTLVDKSTVAGTTPKSKGLYYDAEYNPTGTLVPTGRGGSRNNPGFIDAVYRYQRDKDGVWHDYAIEGVSKWDLGSFTPLTTRQGLEAMIAKKQQAADDALATQKQVIAMQHDPWNRNWNDTMADPLKDPNNPAYLAQQEVLNYKKELADLGSYTPPVVANTSGVNPDTSVVTPSVVSDKPAVTGNDSTLTPQVTLTKQLTPEEIAAQKAALVETPFNAGIVSPDINKVVSKENLNTDVKGTNGESGVVPLLYADMAKNTGRVPTPMVQGWGGTPIPETSMTNTGTPVLAESLPNSNLDNQSYTITSNPNTPAGITSLVGPQQLTPQQLAQQQLLQSTGIGRS